MIYHRQFCRRIPGLLKQVTLHIRMQGVVFAIHRESAINYCRQGGHTAPLTELRSSDGGACT